MVAILKPAVMCFYDFKYSMGKHNLSLVFFENTNDFACIDMWMSFENLPVSKNALVGYMFSNTQHTFCVTSILHVCKMLNIVNLRKMLIFIICFFVIKFVAHVLVNNIYSFYHKIHKILKLIIKKLFPWIGCISKTSK